MPKSRILIVDDDRTTRHLLVRLLERDGFEAVACDNARAALQMIDSERPALIVSDYEMPEYTGAQFCALLRRREDPETASLPVILLTAHGGEEHEVESLEAGANDFVTKPVNHAILKARIDTHLRLHSLRRQLEQQNMELEEWRHSRELDLEAAQLTQRAILPARLPSVAGWEVASHYQPVIQVGGDMYDWLKLPNGRWLFWVADATGHGASAALLTTLTKLVFRHAATEHTTPGAILQAVNGEFHSTLRGKSFMTAACLVLAPEEGALTFSGAGHPPLAVVRHSRHTELFPSKTPPLGILPTQEFGESAIQLCPGDIALLYTDGLYSTEDGRGTHGLPEDLRATVTYDTPSAQDFVERLLRATFQRHESDDLPDDLALIALRRLGA